MGVQIGGKRDSGFDDPIGMLTDCHRRIEHFSNLLCYVAEKAQGRVLQVEECKAIEAALRYFQDSGPRHNRDEEESLFPRLRAAAQAPAELTPLIDRLASEHGQAEALHKESSEVFARWMAEGDLHAADRSRLTAALHNLQQIYTEHIRIEEEVVFLCASRLLDSEAWPRSEPSSASAGTDGFRSKLLGPACWHGGGATNFDEPMQRFC